MLIHVTNALNLNKIEASVAKVREHLQGQDLASGKEDEEIAQAQRRLLEIEDLCYIIDTIHKNEDIDGDSDIDDEIDEVDDEIDTEIITNQIRIIFGRLHDPQPPENLDSSISFGPTVDDIVGWPSGRSLVEIDQIKEKISRIKEQWSKIEEEIKLNFSKNSKEKTNRLKKHISTIEELLQLLEKESLVQERSALLTQFPSLEVWNSQHTLQR